MAKHKNGEIVEWKTHNPRSDKKRTSCFLTGLKRSIKVNPLKSMEKMSKLRNVSKMTISKAVRKDLKMKSYCRQRRCILTAKSKANRIKRNPQFFNYLKNGEGDVRIFMNEKKFVGDKKTNRPNSRVIAKSHEELPAVMESQLPASIRVFFQQLQTNSKITPPHFIKAGTKSNTSEYVKILKEVLMPWIKKHCNHEPITFIQDLAPAHGSKTLQDLLMRELSLFVLKDVWPSSFSDLNPCNYWLWSEIEKVSDNDAHTSIGSLKNAGKLSVN